MPWAEAFDLTEVVETGTSMAGSGMVVAELLHHLTGEVVEIIDGKITRDEYVGGPRWAGY